MCHEMRLFSLNGSVLDLGSGGTKSYAEKMKSWGNMNVRRIDQRGTADFPPINLENDALPLADGQVDHVLMFNILEHLFNFEFAIRQAYRVLASKGKLLGFVPFFCHYHPGPNDFFRYTHEALKATLMNAGFKSERICVKPFGYGPFSAGFHLMFLSLPKVWRRRFRLPLVLFLSCAIVGDKIMQKLWKNSVRDFPLGYLFIGIK